MGKEEIKNICKKRGLNEKEEKFVFQIVKDWEDTQDMDPLKTWSKLQDVIDRSKRIKILEALMDISMHPTQSCFFGMIHTAVV